MAKLDRPLLLSPVFLPKIWGREKLEPLFKRPSSLAREELIGEVWITADDSRIMNGPLSGMTLRDASETFGSDLNGKDWKDHRFPLLAKYLFTSDWLSVQVHPDDDQAARFNPGERGKCESWYIVSSGRKGALLVGVEPGVTEAKLRASFEKGTSRSDLNQFRPKAGEAIFMPPGTIHAIGPDLVLFEVEENSDLTYRLDDFGRKGLDGKPRPLHLEKGMAVARMDAPVLRDLPVVALKESWGKRKFVLACGHFALEELTLQKAGAFQGRKSAVEILTVLSGSGRVETHEGWIGFQTGNTWLIPPGSAEYRLIPQENAQILKFYVPNLERDFCQPLLKRGVQSSKIERIIFT